MKNRLCFGCYGADHIAKNCTKRRTCKICAGKHPSALHGYLPKSEITIKERFAQNPTGNTVTNSTEKTVTNPPENTVTNPTEKTLKNMHVSSYGQTISMSIVPVLLRHNQASKDVMTYALLDNGSQGTFIDEDLVSCLGIK